MRPSDLHINGPVVISENVCRGYEDRRARQDNLHNLNSSTKGNVSLYFARLMAIFRKVLQTMSVQFHRAGLRLWTNLMAQVIHRPRCLLETFMHSPRTWKLSFRIGRRPYRCLFWSIPLKTFRQNMWQLYWYCSKCKMS